MGEQGGSRREELKSTLGANADFHTGLFRIGRDEVEITWLSSVTDPQRISERIVMPLAASAGLDPAPDTTDRLGALLRLRLPAAMLKQTDNAGTAAGLLLEGHVLLRPAAAAASTWYAVQAAAEHYRPIKEPSTQTIIRGPKEGFTESAEVAIGLLRRRIRNPQLRFEKHVLGSETATPVYIAYIAGLANEGFLKELRRRILRFGGDSIFDSGNVEELIADRQLTPFPLVYNSERPDSVASHLLEGKLAVIVEGSPFVLSAPVTFQDFFQSAEDYYQPFLMASAIRLIRYFSFMLALLLPSAYVALITFHHELIPTEFLLSVMAQREGIPFPAFVETFIMEITFEVLREAGIRMPRAIGPTVSIVGGLVIGQAAVEAGIISNIMVIIVALTAIASFVSPIYSMSVSTRLLRFILITLAACMGMYGVLLGLIAMVLHLTSLRSFGVPYLAPIAPFKWRQLRDVFVRLPISVLKKRPRYLNPRKNE